LSGPSELPKSPCTRIRQLPELDKPSSDPVIPPKIEEHWPPDSAKASGIAKSESDAVNTTAPTRLRAPGAVFLVFFAGMIAISLHTSEHCQVPLWSMTINIALMISSEFSRQGIEYTYPVLLRGKHGFMWIETAID
jgi:hypothetical protein